MVTIIIEYEGDLHCKAVHGPSGSALFSDAPTDNQGRGESFSPTDLVATALGTCMLTVMGIAARGLGLDLAGSTATVTKAMAAAPLRKISRLAVDIRVPHALSDDHKRRLEAAAHTCPVSNSIHPDIDVPVSFHWG
jgi:putative redox protein